MNKNNIFFFNITFLFLSSISVNAQDTHYWTQQYGTKSSLLGGAAIGGVRDNSGVYYNPGAIGFINNKNLSITANAYQLDRIKLIKGGGNGIDLSSSGIQTMPLIISGLLKAEKHPKHTLGYCMLTKDQFEINTNARYEDSKNLLNDSYANGNEDYTDQFNLISSVYEVMAGWAYGYKVSDKFSIGIGNYGSYRSYHSDYNRNVRVIPTDSNLILQEISTFDRSYSIGLKNVRTVFKLGAALNLKKWKFGLTLTSPSINVWGQGSMQSDVTVSNIDYFGTGTLISLTANTRQDKLKTTYKTPLTIGFGAEYSNDKTTFAFSCEWFDKVKDYTIIKANGGAYLRPAILGIFTSSDVLKINEEKKSVFNYAIGFEQKITDKYYASIGFRTNKSYSTVEKLAKINLTYTNWDIYHTSFGITKKREKSDISVAINYAISAKKDIYQYANLTNSDASNFFEGNPEKASAKFTSFAFMIGYTHRLK